jgi:signal transduction histidine kinase
MQGQPSPATPPFERIIFWLRWPFWALIALVALAGPSAHIDPVTLAAVLAAAAGLNLLLFLVMRTGFLPRLIQPLFGTLDFGVMIALFLSGGVWPTPLFPFAFFPIIVCGVRWGALVGLVGGAAMGLAGLGIYATQSVERLAELSYLEQAIPLFSMPALGSLTGHLRALANGGQLRVLSAEVEELRMTRDRADGVYAMASMLGATVNYQKVLETLFDLSAIEFRALGLDPLKMVGMALLFEERGHQPRLQVAGAHRIADEDWNVRCAGREGILARALGSSQAITAGPLAADAELGQFKSLRAAQSAILVPLRTGFDSYGVILFAALVGNAYDLDLCHFLIAFSNQASIALQNARLFQSLRDEQTRIIDQQEEARRILARELHDGPAQTIAALAMRLNYARVLVNSSPERAVAELADLEDITRRTSKEIRTMLFTLRPVVLETQGLAAALRQYGDRLRETDGLVVTVDDSRFGVVLNDDTQGVIFSILEEAINNARKHAHARRVTVTLEAGKENMLARVQDDGVGFDVDKVLQSYDQRGSLGLMNMRERGALIDGNVTLESKPGAGATVTLVAPLRRVPTSQKKADRSRPA